MRALAAISGMVWLLGCSADGEVIGPNADRPDASRAPDVASDVQRAVDVAPTPPPPPPPPVEDVPVAPRDVMTPAADVSAPVDVEDLTPDETPDGGLAPVDAEPVRPTMGGTMRVTATSLNLRNGAGTSSAILTSMACGTQVIVLGGPTSGWWNVRYMTTTGWASGAYLVAESAYSAATCGGSVPTMPPPASMSGEVDQMFELARPAVSYSYYWGHGSWRNDGASHGSCSGSCPSCSHSGSYGADCSGFVAKCWQIPGPSPITTDAHPYSTYNFYNSSTHWSRVSRTSLRPGDALTYNSGGSGHIVLYERGTDPWGSLWVYEARGCSYGIVHNSRAFGSTYVGIRREGL